MSTNFFQSSQDFNVEEIDESQFFDGKQKIIPDETELNFEVKDCFFGIPEGKSLMSCLVNVAIVGGEYAGQMYRFTAKLWDMNAKTVDKAKTNLGVIDAQAGFPMGNNGFDMTTENLNYHWAGIVFNEQTGDFDRVKPAARGRLKMGMLLSTTDAQGNPKLDANGEEVVEEVNFIKGFAYDRATMVQPAGKPQQATNEPQQAAQPQQAPVEEDVDF